MKLLRIIARLNVGGPARHVVWLTDGLRANGYDTLLVTGVVPSGEDDMTYFAHVGHSKRATGFPLRQFVLWHVVDIVGLEEMSMEK